MQRSCANAITGGRIMIVTLDVYSGRPNPSWRLSDKDHARLLERVSGRALADETEFATDAALGPRGFVISAARDDEAPEGVPFAFRIGLSVRGPQAVGESIDTPPLDHDGTEGLSFPRSHRAA